MDRSIQLKKTDNEYDQGSEPGNTELLGALDKPGGENDLALLIRFSKPDEMRKAYKVLSDIPCTIMCQSSENITDIADTYNSQQKKYTKRECDVLNILAKGYSYSETAAHLDCKLSTVQTHVKHLYSKLGVHSRSEAVHEAIHLGLIKI